MKSDTEISSHSEELIAEIKRRALMFFVDNSSIKDQLNYLETAMLIGASVAMELNTNAEITLNAWQEAFGTTQLTHALARLEAAERKANRRR